MFSWTKGHIWLMPISVRNKWNEITPSGRNETEWVSQSLNELLVRNVFTLSVYLRLCCDWKSWILATALLELGNVSSSCICQILFTVRSSSVGVLLVWRNSLGLLKVADYASLLVLKLDPKVMTSFQYLSFCDDEVRTFKVILNQII